VIQLKNLDLYLMEGRTRITEARRKLQELAAEDAGARRGRAGRAQAGRASSCSIRSRCAAGRAGRAGRAPGPPRTPHRSLELSDAKAPAVLPGWLEPPVIASARAGSRPGSRRSRALQAAADARPRPRRPRRQRVAGPRPRTPSGRSCSSGSRRRCPPWARPARRWTRRRQALATSRSCRRSTTSRRRSRRSPAIEQFSDLKQLVELAWSEHQALRQLLAPEAAKQLDAATRSRQTHELLSHNLGRDAAVRRACRRRAGQLDEQAKQVEAKGPRRAQARGRRGAQVRAQLGRPDPQKAQLEQARQQLEQARQQMQRAEELRGKAPPRSRRSTRRWPAAPIRCRPPSKPTPSSRADRKLFFSVIEHSRS